MSKFTHLNVHSHYSLLDALPKIDELVKTAKKEGLKALALTDNGNLYGAIEFYKTALKASIKPILGIHAYVAVRTRRDRQAGVDNRRTRLILLAKNETGYRNLLKIATKSHLEGFYYRPRVDKELLKEHGDGLMAILPSWNSPISSALVAEDISDAEKILGDYRNIFGADSLFIELTLHPELTDRKKVAEGIRHLGKISNTPLVASHEIYYLSPEDKRARDILTLVNTGGDIMERANREDGGDFHFLTTKEMEERFKDDPEALRNSLKIADECNLNLSLGKWVFPDYKTRDGKTHDQELREMVSEGLAKRGLSKTPEISERIEYELGIIKTKGYAPYFLVVGDLMRYAHEKGILTTIRGSVAGSIVTFLAGITNVNPIEYKLPFERFLNPERPSPPDIDMDFADNRRDEMIDYARKKYGEDKVAQIGTFGTMLARGSVRDVARALGHEYAVGDQIAKLIPLGSQGFPMSIERAMEMVPELADLYKKNEVSREIINVAKKIEGCARHISVHAAGVVIAPKPLSDFVPLQLDPKGGKIITEYDMHAVEDAGLLKLDFLGIKNLAILASAVSLVEKLEGVKIDIENVPLDDKKTFTVLASGETGGLFQLNGSGMTRYLKELKPTTIHDINAMVALYRPGPMESIPQYIERKHDSRLIKYLDPRLKEILADSYGVITYQDDVMLIAIRMAGYSWLEADKLRKAMGKKIPAEMEAQKENLTNGLAKNGLEKNKAEALWKLIEPFAAYGFNKAHAASYGKVAYQTAYMKANFPAIYMSAVLTAESGDVEKVGETIAECKRMGIEVLPPSINESFSGFTVVKTPIPDLPTYKLTNLQTKIRFGLTTIKNFGEGVADSIIAERKNAGRFSSLSDFLRRIRDKNLNKKSLEALIKSGALDEFGERGTFLGNLEKLLLFAKESANAPENQSSLFSTLPNAPADIRLDAVKVVAQTEKLAWEKELLGLYISGHPLDKWRTILDKREVNIKKIREGMKEGMMVVVGGIIEEARTILTKGNEQMMFAKISDFTGSLEAVVFPRVFTEHKKLLAPEKCVIIKGRISERNGEKSIIAEKIKPLE